MKIKMSCINNKVYLYGDYHKSIFVFLSSKIFENEKNTNG